MRQWGLVFGAGLGLAILAGWPLDSSRPDPRADSSEPPPAETLAPLGESATPVKSLPADALVLTFAQGAQIEEPFAVRDNATAATGAALVIPKGAGSKTRKGKAQLVLDIPAPAAAPAPPVPAADGDKKPDGPYRAWVRVLWRDSCSNSATLKVGAAAPRDIGNDCVYGCWHWVDAGEHTLAPGKTPVVVGEREDGVALDQILFTRDAAYLPTGPIGQAGERSGIRRFADDFNRSPGHGLGEWDPLSGKWSISFTFDPNRLPHQYALLGEATANPNAESGPALLLAKGPPWRGCRISCAFMPVQDGTYGAVLERSAGGDEALQLLFRVAAGKAELLAQGRGLDVRADLGGAVALNQWHHVVVERWAWVTRVEVDERVVFEDYRATPRTGRAGFVVLAGSAAFDDVALEDIPWQADDGEHLQAPWTVNVGAEWYRVGGPAAPDGKAPSVESALVGRAGIISTGMGGMGLEEIMWEDSSSSRGCCVIRALGLEEALGGQSAAGRQERLHVLRRPRHPAMPSATAAALEVQGAEVRLRRVAFRYGERVADRLVAGPYHFTDAVIEDPSDYLDFTPEEYKEIAKSPDRQKLLRQAKTYTMVADPSEERGVWLRESGSWRVKDGMLTAVGPNAVLRHPFEVRGALEIRMKVRIPDKFAAAEVELYAGNEPGIRIQIAAEERALWKLEPGAFVVLPVVAGEQWHTLHARVNGGMMFLALDDQINDEMRVPLGDGGRILLKAVSGRVDFDDVEIIAPRYTPQNRMYDFHQREGDWFREGPWMDHGGISCVLTSHWVSLLAAKGRGVLWNKRAWGPDVQVGSDIEENADWYGWRKDPTHAHYPFDNICMLLATDAWSPTAGSGPGWDRGYRLEVNSQNRKATVLYRNGKEVARVVQDGKFPMQYQGGHAPYLPRRGHVSLLKRGKLLRGFVNGKEVLRYEDPEPLDVKAVGVGGYDTRFNFAHLEVRQLGPNERSWPWEPGTPAVKRDGDF